MKIRSDFVTNSSSSSFIIAKKSDEEIGRLEAFIVSKVFSDEITDYKIATIEELNEWFVDRYVWNDKPLEEYLKENEKECDVIEYFEIKGKIEEGYIIYDLSIDYEEETLVEILRELCKENDHFVMICED